MPGSLSSPNAQGQKYPTAGISGSGVPAGAVSGHCAHAGFYAANKEFLVYSEVLVDLGAKQVVVMSCRQHRVHGDHEPGVIYVEFV